MGFRHPRHAPQLRAREALRELAREFAALAPEGALPEAIECGTWADLSPSTPRHGEKKEWDRPRRRARKDRQRERGA